MPKFGIDAPTVNSVRFPSQFHAGSFAIPFDTLSMFGCENPVSCLSHLLAAPVFAVLGWSLVQRGQGDWPRVWGLVVYAVTTVFVLTMSGVYHLLAPSASRDLFRQLDIAGIFALIAGTATPVYIMLFRGVQRWAPILLFWIAAIVGIVLRTLYPVGLQPMAANGIFLMMGWSGLIGIYQLYRRFGLAFVAPLLWGGCAYTVGAIVLTCRWPVLIPGFFGAHELWHLGALAGLGFHWTFVFGIANGRHAESPTIRMPNSAHASEMIGDGLTEENKEAA